MPAAAPPPPPLDRLFAELEGGVQADRTRTFAGRADLLQACLLRLDADAETWVAAGCAAKGVDPGSPAVADEWANGPLAVARHLRSLHTMARGLAAGRLPSVRCARGHAARIVATPRGLVDHLSMPGYRAVVDVEPDQPLQIAPPAGGQGIHVVLGAGNISSMPVGDALDAIGQRGAAVLLKLSPLHERLLPVIARVLQPLVDADLLRLCIGDADVGRAVVQHPSTTAWHLTGAPATLRAVLLLPAARAKAWTAELGNVTPVIVLPGRWPDRELRAAARQIAAMFAQNAACNCVTPRLLLTAAAWPQQRLLLTYLANAIAALPPRLPFHPGARERFARFAGQPAPAGPLPFVLRTDVDYEREPHVAAEESFAPVLAAVSLPGADATAFAAHAGGWLRERAFGALAAHLLVANSVLAGARAAVATLLADLPHGTVAINTGAAVGYAFMTTPWGTGARAHGPDRGRGFAHGTLCLRAPLRTIVHGPLRPWPAPPWLPLASAVPLLTALTRFHIAPSLPRATHLLTAALHHR